MPRTSIRTHSSRTALLAWSSLAFLLPALAQTVVIAEGRLAAPVPGDRSGEHYYERKRIKRTVPLDPASFNPEDWNLLATGLPGEPLKASYFNWDEHYLYVAVETETPQDIRVELDALGDGWLHGAENLSLRLIPTTDASGAKVLAQRYDTLQNPAKPVWALSPIPEEKILTRMGKSSRGTCTTLALPLTELLGLKRKPGAEFGLRLLAGEAALVDTTTELPQFKLILAEDIEALHQNLRVHLSLRDKEFVPGALVRGTIEVQNSGAKPLFLKRYTFPDGSSLEDPKDPAMIINPGERFKREWRFLPRAGSDPASLALKATVEQESGEVLTALASVDQLDPYQLSLDLDTRPISFKTPDGPGRQRLVVATVRSRKDGKMEGTVRLQLPEGWTVEGSPSRTVSLTYGPESKPVTYKVVVPAKTPPGTYSLEATAEIGGRPYRASAVLKVQ